MRSRIVLTLVLALLPGPLVAQVPQVIPPEWVVEQFLSHVDAQGPLEERQDSLWIRVRNRPEIVDLLIEIGSDSARTRLVRANAILRLGATSQLRAYEHLARLLSVLEPESPYRLNAILGLGSGYVPRPPFVYERLTDVLRTGTQSERRAAAYAFGMIRSERALQILRARLPNEGDPVVASTIREVLEERTP